MAVRAEHLRLHLAREAKVDAGAARAEAESGGESGDEPGGQSRGERGLPKAQLRQSAIGAKAEEAAGRRDGGSRCELQCRLRPLPLGGQG